MPTLQTLLCTCGLISMKTTLVLPFVDTNEIDCCTPFNPEAYAVRLAYGSRAMFDATRTIRLRTTLGAVAVTDAAHRLDVPGAVAQFQAQRTDVDVDRALQRICVFAAAGVEQFEP